MPVKLGMTHAQLIDAINSDIGLIKDQGSKIITKEFPASETETSSVQLDIKCQGKDYIFVFMDYGILEPSNYSLSADGLTVNFSPAIPANHKIIIRYFTPGSSFTNYVTDEFQSNLLNYTTNRILEIPQNIKLELNDGVLTLKAGSKVWYPDGLNEDGSKKFSPRITTSDLISSNNPYDVRSLVLYDIDKSRLTSLYIEQFYSGETEPTALTAESRYFWYDTNNNFIKTKLGSETVWSGKYSFTVGIATSSVSNGYKSIDQVFNGFGYIGSTAFALPGVKVQIPNGRNEDGSCKNLLYTETSVKTFTSRSDWGAGVFHAYIGDTTEYDGSQYDFFPAADSVTKSSEKNLYFDTVTGWYNSWCPVVSLYWDSTGKITSFTPFIVDSVVNSNASNFSQAGRSYLSGLGMPSSKYIDLTPGASGATYTAPANGWFCACAEGTAGQTTISIEVIGIGITSGYTTGTNGNGTPRVTIPVSSGNVVKMDYLAITSWHWFRFVYAKGEQ